MDSNGLPGGMYPRNVQSGMLGLEMSLHHQNPLQQHHTMLSYPQHEADYNHAQAQQSSKQAPSYPDASKPKTKPLTLSDDDEPGGGYSAENNSVDDDKNRKMSPWHRMKWTDDMVKLLIMVVYYIGDEVVSEPNDPSGKKKAAGVLQKKGKWKSVSRAMMERGFYVSPQQCEDKFNDLNKRYKRVNDILGKGTACRVVENQSLLKTMDHLSPKMMEEVKKLLNSKHLFFREMCAYHNSCGHNAGGDVGASNVVSQTAQTQQHQQSCLHSKENGKVAKETSIEDEDDDEDEDNDEDEEDDDEEDEEDNVDRGRAELTNERSSSKKRTRESAFLSPSNQQLDAELANLLRDSTKSSFEKRQWMRTKLMGLEEQRFGIQSQAFDIEKQRLKWLKFSYKKEREMEREKLTNERLKLENERMVLLIRQKEIDLIDNQQQLSSNKMSDPSSITG